MDASTPINRSGKVMVSVAGLRRLLSNAYQAELTEEMLVSVVDRRSGTAYPGGAYRQAGLAADCRWVPVLDTETGQMTDPQAEFVEQSDLEGTCEGTIYLDRERVCELCGRKVLAPEVVAWIKGQIRFDQVVKSFTNMDTEEFWDGMWADFERIENCPPGELARMVGG